MKKTFMLDGTAMTFEEISNEWEKVRCKYDDECLLLGRSIVEAFSRMKHAEELQNRMRKCLDGMSALRYLEGQENDRSQMDQTIR